MYLQGAVVEFDYDPGGQARGGTCWPCRFLSVRRDAIPSIMIGCHVPNFASPLAVRAGNGVLSECQRTVFKPIGARFSCLGSVSVKPPYNVHTTYVLNVQHTTQRM